MICGTFVLDSVPDDQAESTVAGFRNNDPPPTSVDKTKNADGTWKITAVWPPCSNGVTTTHSPGN